MKPTGYPGLVEAAAIAALAFVVACTGHEVLGHGTACLAQGGRIALLTSVYFRCTGGGVLADLGGPLANAVLASGAWALLARLRLSPAFRTFLSLSFAFNLFWLAACLLESVVSDRSDFSYALRLLAVHPPWLGRATLGMVGLLLYWAGVRCTPRYLGGGAVPVVAYLVAGVVSCVAALFYAGPVGPALAQAALEGFGSAIGLLLIATRPDKRVDAVTGPVGSGWLVAGMLSTAAFCWWLGGGLIVRVHA